MSRILNPLNKLINDLFHHMNTLNGLLSNLENQLNNFKKLYKDSISKTSFDISRIAAPGFLHHPTQGGNCQQYIFKDKDGFTSRMEGLFGRQPKYLSPGRFCKN